MSQLVRFTDGSDRAFLIEVSPVLPVAVDQVERSHVVTRSGVGQDAARRVAEGASSSLRDAVQEVLPAAQVVLEALNHAVRGPDQITLQFGIGLTAGAGAFIASATASANFAVTLTWNRSSGTAAADAGSG